MSGIGPSVMRSAAASASRWVPRSRGGAVANAIVPRIHQRLLHSSPSRSSLLPSDHSRGQGLTKPSGALLQQRRTMFIQTETTPNDASLKFIPGVEVTTTGTYEFLDLRSALPSPLATRLLSIDGLTGVFFGPDFVTCSKDDSFSWPLLKPEIFATMMEHFSSGAPLFRDGEDVGGAEDTRILESDSEVVAMVKELLETRVRPAIQEDGGDIEYKGLDEGTGMVKLRLKGSCRGCSSSSVTLKNGIERMLMHYVPEVKGVEQVLDEEERISLDEFAKFEAKLEKKAQASTTATPDMSQYMST